MEKKEKLREISKNDVKSIQLDLLKYIDDICRKENIKYYLIGGSLIGAIRHKGMIPWDDDIDISLFRGDYDKIIKKLSENNNERYKILESSIEKDYYLPFAKLVDKRTKAIEVGFKDIKDYGVFIDIFPLENLPNNEKEIKKQHDKIKSLDRCILYGNKNLKHEKNNLKKLAKYIFKLWYKYLGEERALKKHKEITTKYNNIESKYVMTNWPAYNAENDVYKKEDFLETIDCEFDGLNVMIPANYDSILKITFGDYMTPPPLEKRTSPHTIEFYWR